MIVDALSVNPSITRINTAAHIITNLSYKQRLLLYNKLPHFIIDDTILSVSDRVLYSVNGTIGDEFDAKSNTKPRVMAHLLQSCWQLISTEAGVAMQCINKVELG